MESPEARRRTMQAVKSKNTSIEIRVRRLLYAQGYRYRLHKNELPGCPDLVFTRFRKIIFIHGCFWHGHRCARGKRVPKSNTDYWRPKYPATGLVMRQRLISFTSWDGRRWLSGNAKRRTRICCGSA